MASKLPDISEYPPPMASSVPISAEPKFTSQSLRDIFVEELNRLVNDRYLEKNFQKSRSFWQKLRITGGGPPFYKNGGKVLYLVGDVIDWLEKRKHTSTSSY